MAGSPERRLGLRYAAGMSRAGDTPPQDVRFCRSADGTRIAYAVHGSGPPLLLAACWLSHLEFDWQSPVWRHFLLDLGRVATVIRYDERGNGMSDWDVTDFGLEPRVADLEAVADAAGLDRFAMVGMSQGGPVGVAYAARHPGRLSRLILYGTYGRAMDHTDPQAVELEQTFRQMIKVGWARPDSTFRRVFTNLLIPGASDEQAGWLDDLQARATSTENAVQARAGRMEADVRDLLPELTVPTLVVHARARPHDRLRAGPRAGRADPGRPAGDAGQRQPHHAGRRAGLAGVRRRGGRLPGPRPGRRGNPRRRAALAHRPRARRAAPGRAGPRQRGGRDWRSRSASGRSNAI